MDQVLFQLWHRLKNFWKVQPIFLAQTPPPKGKYKNYIVWTSMFLKKISEFSACLTRPPPVQPKVLTFRTFFYFDGTPYLYIFIPHIEKWFPTATTINCVQMDQFSELVKSNNFTKMYHSSSSIWTSSCLLLISNNRSNILTILSW